MRPAYRLVAVIASLASSAVLFAGVAVAARPGSLAMLKVDPRLSGPGVDISVVIPSGWHETFTERPPQFLQMVYPDTCSTGLACASAIARTGSGPGSNARMVAEAAERSIIAESGVQDFTITREGPFRLAGRPGYQVRSTFSNPYAKFRAELAVIETGPVSSGGGRMSLVFVAVSDLPGAPTEGVIDQIVNSVQFTP
ncbi:MAG: hypothetical protein ACRDRA_20880 [Pseudonocardiaceae bacterium]